MSPINTPIMPKPNAQRLAILTDLRLAACLTLAAMAQRCGLRGNQSHQTAGAWERGEMVPNAGRRRMHFMGYLWDDLDLRHDPARFEAVWELLMEEWLWEPISDREWAELTSQPRAKPIATSAPAAPSLVTPPPFQAPPPIPHFVGREATLHQLTALLRAPEAPRTVALVGMGGIGKTTVATHAAHALRQHFCDGVLWAQTAISAPLDILHSWARAFGYDYSGLHDVESCAAALRSAVADKQLLLIIDDIGSVQGVRPLLIGGAQSAVLLTTRSDDVAAALNSQICPLSELAATEGLQLLVKLLGAARVAQEQAEAVAICDRLHHLPLAVEIVGQLLAARSRRPLAQMAQRLQEVQYRLDLQISDRDVRTSFLVSWEALDKAQQRVFAHLALFAGRSFTVQALAALLDEDYNVVLEQLDTLVARSLVKAVEGDRYRQHPLLADFAHEQLGDAPAVWQRYAKCQLTFARHHQTDYAALEPEWDNVMAGIETAHRLGMWEVVLDYAEVLTEPWFTRGRFDQARQGYQFAVDAARTTDQHYAVVCHLWHWGTVDIEQSNYIEAGHRLGQALDLSMQLEDGELIANIQWDLARIAVEQTNYELARPLLSSCRNIRMHLNNDTGIAAVDYWYALIYFREQAFDEAENLCQQSLKIQEQNNDRVGMLRTLRLLTDIELGNNNLQGARKYAESAYDLAKTINEQGELGAALFSLCKIDRQLGNLLQAEESIQQSQSIFERIGSRTFLAFTHHELGRIYSQRQKYAEGLQSARQCVDILRAVGDEFNLVTALYYQAELYMLIIQADYAYIYWQEALQLAEKHGHRLLPQIQQKLSG